MPTPQYLSFHIHYAEPWERLLTDSIHPLVKRLIREGSIKQYFFIRYWERGPHIRLRLKKEDGVEAEEISQMVREDIGSFMLENPSQLSLTPEMEAAKAATSWRDNNQVFSVAYEPETSRFGGAGVLPLAEFQFFASSQMVLNELAANPDWSYDYALGTAIKRHLSFVFALRMNADTAAVFFEKICEDWLPGAISRQGVAIPPRAIEEQFQRAYEVQKASVLPYIHGIWKELQESPPESQSAILKSWLHTNYAVYTNLQLAKKAGILKTEKPKPEYRHIPDAVLWNILGDFVHLTNNRLGVLNRDEGFLAYMLTKALKGLRDVK